MAVSASDLRISNIFPKWFSTNLVNSFGLKKSGVYVIRNKKNGKEYIGSATKLRSRLINHIRELVAGTHYNKKMLSDFISHGICSFEVDIIEECKSPSVLYSVEQKYIDEKKPAYNSSIYADPRDAFRASEHKEKSALGKRGKKHSPEHAAKLRANLVRYWKTRKCKNQLQVK